MLKKTDIQIDNVCIYTSINKHCSLVFNNKSLHILILLILVINIVKVMMTFNN